MDKDQSERILRRWLTILTCALVGIVAVIIAAALVAVGYKAIVLLLGV